MKTPTFSLVVAAATLLGCAKGNSNHAAAPNGGKFYAVTAQQAAFYRYGPQQGNGPDQQLAHDTLVTLIRPSFGYCKVRLLDGQQGYVAREDIQVASPQLVAAVTAPPPVPSSTPSLRVDASDPRFQAPPPLPENFPEPTPIPEAADPPQP